MAVSIPQAVSTVATRLWEDFLEVGAAGFNTASGKYCCNKVQKLDKVRSYLGSFQYRKR